MHYYSRKALSRSQRDKLNASPFVEDSRIQAFWVLHLRNYLPPYPFGLGFSLGFGARGM